MKFIYLSLVLLPAMSFAQISTTAKEEFCQKRLSSPDSIQKILTTSNNQLSFYNQGGLFGAGVCWWHSRFNRAAAYLAVFDPSLPRPSLAEAKDLISQIRHRKGMVTIPGFRNLQEFSTAYGNEILSKLGDWQRSDGVLKASWVKGLSGNDKVSSEDLQEKMDELYTRINRGEVVYQKLQMPGVTAHAWLVIGMKAYDFGYQLQIVDSNSVYNSTETYLYMRGQTSFQYSLDGQTIPFVPYTGETGEEEKLRQKMNDFCQK